MLGAPDDEIRTVAVIPDLASQLVRVDEDLVARDEDLRHVFRRVRPTGSPLSPTRQLLRASGLLFLLISTRDPAMLVFRACGHALPGA